MLDVAMSALSTRLRNKRHVVAADDIY